jgi:hypothetical protein
VDTPTTPDRFCVVAPQAVLQIFQNLATFQGQTKGMALKDGGLQRLMVTTKWIDLECDLVCL